MEDGKPTLPANPEGAPADHDEEGRGRRFFPTEVGRVKAELGRWLAKIIEGLSLREGNLFLVLSVVIGLASGLLVVCFHIAIEQIHLWSFGSSLSSSPLRLLVVPTVAGLAIAASVMTLFRQVRGSGVNQTKAAVYIYDGYIPFRTVIGKFLLSALAIGSGQSLGPEDPSLQIGAGLASTAGRWLRLSREKIRMIAPIGAAAGLAAAFNAPISAIVFVLEEVIGQWSAGVLGAIILAAVSSVVVMRGFLGSEPLFRVPATATGVIHPSEFLAYGVLGVIGGFAGLIFTKIIVSLRSRLKALPRSTQYFQPAVAGLLVGVIGLGFPQVMGSGYYFIDQAMHAQYVWQVLALLAVFKIIATTVSFTSGTPGGMFAPALFIGAMIGGAVGGVEHHFFPALTGPVSTYALVGMGTMFAAFLRAPMTSVFMVLELSGNYSIILPVMVSNTIAYLISRNYQAEGLFDTLSRQDGVELPSIEEQREETRLRVEDAMRPPREPVLSGSEAFQDALTKIGGSSEQRFLVNLRRGVWSVVARETIQEQVRSGNGEQPLSTQLRGSPLPWLHPDQSLDTALRLIAGRPFLPVVSRVNPERLQGVIAITDILEVYGQAGGRAYVPESE
ncbi:MAG: chloride channel protein [Terriglobia bacterium]